VALKEVIVTSHHVHACKDKHLGIEYTFEPNAKVQIPLATAVHFFGLGRTDRSLAWKRYGFTEEAKGEAFLKKFELKVVDLVPADTGIESLTAEHAKTLEEVKAEHQAEIEKLEADHYDEIARINEMSALETTALKNRIAELEAASTKSHKK
jgi:hypothetical protein